MMALCILCILMTIMFIYVSSKADARVDEIRQDYKQVAERRDAKVARLTKQVADLQGQIATLPDKTATKTADKVNQVVKEDEAK